MLLPALYFLGGVFTLEGQPVLGVAAIAALVLVNLAVTRLAPDRVLKTATEVAIAVAQASLLVLCWYAGGQVGLEMLTCSVSILVLALVGLSMGELAATALAMVAVYLVIV